MAIRKNNSMSIVSGLFFGAGIFAVAGAASGALGSASYTGASNYYRSGSLVSNYYGGSDESVVSFDSVSGGIGSGWSLAEGESIAFVGGRANSANLSLGAYAQVVSTASNSHLSDATINVSSSNKLTIMPGNSGLSVGDTTQLTLKLRLDGSLYSKVVSYPDSGEAYAEMEAGLEVHDYAIQIDTGEGYWSPELASFGASSELDSYDVYAPFWNYNYSSSKDYSWGISSNMSDGTDGYFSDGTKGTNESFHYDDGITLDTQELTIVFEAIVGHTLDFDADMSIYASVSNEGFISADYYNTMGFDVLTAEGVELNWNVVPEPASMLMLGTGALFLKRRRKA